MPNSPAVSVIIPLYNKEREVERAIRSVLTQTFQNFEIVVVNDGSTDDSPKVAKRMNESRIKLIHQGNQGVSAARNHGIEKARAELIAFLDADDEWKPEFLKTIMGLRSNFPQADVFATSYIVCDGNGVHSAPGINGIPDHPWEGILENYFDIAAKSDPPLWTSAVAVTKKAITSIGGFPVVVRNGEDLLTWAKLAIRYQIAYSTLPSAVFWRPTGIDARPGRYDDTVDVVGRELDRLLQKTNGLKNQQLRNYISLWHKMRASLFLQIGDRTKALYEIGQSAHYGKMTPKLCAYRVCASTPKFLCRWLIRWMIRGQRIVLNTFGTKWPLELLKGCYRSA